jgi:hypothetical protein
MTSQTNGNERSAISAVCLQIRILALQLLFMHLRLNTHCGQLCILALSGYTTGIRANLAHMRLLKDFDDATLSMREMRDRAEKMGLRLVPLHSVDISVESLDMPCILHLKSNHFILCIERLDAYSVIYDPSSGVVKVYSKVLESLCSGFLLRSNESMLDESDYFGTVRGEQLGWFVRNTHEISRASLLFCAAIGELFRDCAFSVLHCWRYDRNLVLCILLQSAAITASAICADIGLRWDLPLAIVPIAFAIVLAYFCLLASRLVESILVEGMTAKIVDEFRSHPRPLSQMRVAIDGLARSRCSGIADLTFCVVILPVVALLAFPYHLMGSVLYGASFLSTSLAVVFLACLGSVDSKSLRHFDFKSLVHSISTNRQKSDGPNGLLDKQFSKEHERYGPLLCATAASSSATSPLLGIFGWASTLVLLMGAGWDHSRPQAVATAPVVGVAVWLLFCASLGRCLARHSLSTRWYRQALDA